MPFLDSPRAAVFAAVISASGAVLAAVWSAKVSSEGKISARVEAERQLALAREGLREEAAATAKRVVQLEIEKLRVSCAGSVTADGVVKSYKGIPFSVTREPEGRFRINFTVPFKDIDPIVVA